MTVAVCDALGLHQSDRGTGTAVTVWFPGLVHVTVIELAGLLGVNVPPVTAQFALPFAV
jgi:hypothetical protein